jgi:FdhD protein
MVRPIVVREAAPAGGAAIDLLRVAAGRAEATTDVLAVEEPLEIRLDGWRWLVTMRTPGDDADLILGLLASEGAIVSANEVEAILFSRHPDEPDLANLADVRLARPLGALRERLARAQALVSASCGLCGAASVEAILARRPRPSPPPRVDAAVLAAVPARMAEAQPVFRATGGLHAAALFTARGARLAAREDIGRHNATDKALGWRLRAGDAGARAAILAVSGRASFEIVQKAVAAAIPIVVAVSAPSSLAVALAREAGMVLAGFARGGSLNLYAGAAHVTGAARVSAAPAVAETSRVSPPGRDAGAVPARRRAR